MGRRTTPPFDAQRFLESAGLGKHVVVYAPKEVIFSQGDPCDSVMYVRTFSGQTFGLRLGTHQPAPNTPLIPRAGVRRAPDAALMSGTRVQGPGKGP